MAAPDGRAAAADFDGTPAVYVYCELRSSRLIWYRCACRSTRKRMPRDHTGGRRAIEPTCKAAGLARALRAHRTARTPIRLLKQGPAERFQLVRPHQTDATAGKPAGSCSWRLTRSANPTPFDIPINEIPPVEAPSVSGLSSQWRSPTAAADALLVRPLRTAAATGARSDSCTRCA